jgi:hypothetical protein
MGERVLSEEASPKDESILTDEFIEPILKVTKEFLRYHGHLGPALILRMEDGEQEVIPLAYFDSLKTVEERREYFASLGLSIRQTSDRIREALLVSEVWYVEPEEEGSLDIAPSKHPKRKEGISIVGRNSRGTRFTEVLQSFSRDINNKPVYEPLKDARYNLQGDEESRPAGLMDRLFD